jgi:hypothetical protein
MAFMAAAAPAIAAASTALAVGGTAYNVMEQRRKAREIEKTRNAAMARVEKGRREATQAWNEALTQTSKGSQDEQIAEQAARERALYEAATGDVAESAAPEKLASADAPKVVKTEMARQLGDKLEQARQQQIALANLKGWDRSKFLTGIDLSRAGQKIGQLAGFQQGWAGAAQSDATNIAQQHSPIGDILSGLGQAGMQAGAADWSSLGWGGAAPVTAQGQPWNVSGKVRGGRVI